MKWICIEKIAFYVFIAETLKYHLLGILVLTQNYNYYVSVE